MDLLKKYLKDERCLKSKVIEHYLADIRFYNSRFIPSENYEYNFSVDNINNYLLTRKSSTALAALRNYLKFLDVNQKISHIDFLKYNERLTGLSRIRVDFDAPCHTESEIEFIFSNKVNYRFKGNLKRNDDELALIAPLIWALSYYCGMEQRHIRSLSIDDVDLTNARIRNPYAEREPNLEEWLPLENYVLEKIINLLEMNNSEDKNMPLITFKRNRLENQVFTKANSILSRSENNCFETTVNCQSLIRTGFYHSLKKSKGSSIVSLAQRYGITNLQLTYAFNKHSSEFNL